jgi:hypothetical protein
MSDQSCIKKLNIKYLGNKVSIFFYLGFYHQSFDAHTQ